MYCPSCNHLLQKLSVTTNHGKRFDVDHCGHCGGTWFDPYELNRIPYHEVSRLAKLTVLPKKLILTQSPRLCPRCHREMKRVHFDSTPFGVHFFRCHHCSGIWATQKALENFKIGEEHEININKTPQIAFPSLSVIFTPALLILALALTAIVTVNNLQDTKTGEILAAQAITNVRIEPLFTDKAFIIFQTNTPFRSYISFGPSQLEMKKTEVSIASSKLHKRILSNLSRGKTYFYRIILINDSGVEITGELSFFTQKAD